MISHDLNNNKGFQLYSKEFMKYHEQFKKVTYEQIAMMKHAIGLTAKGVGIVRKGTLIATRNHFYASEAEYAAWDELVALGLAVKNNTTPVAYHLTNAGKGFLESVTGVMIIEDNQLKEAIIKAGEPVYQSKEQKQFEIWQQAMIDICPGPKKDCNKASGCESCVWFDELLGTLKHIAIRQKKSYNK